LAHGDALALYGEEALIGEQCGNSAMLNDFSSKGNMELAGWWFNWTDDFTFKPLMYKDFVPPDSYWGFMMYGRGGISLRVKGEGTLTLDFGNLLGTPDSKVSVYLNLVKQATAGPSVLSQTVDIPYQDSDALTIAQDGKGIIVINRISFKCTTTTTPPPETSPETHDQQKIREAKDSFKRNHEELERAAQVAETKGKEHFAAVKLAEASEKVAREDREEEKELRQEAAKSEESARKQMQQEKHESQLLVAALLDVLDNDGSKPDGLDPQSLVATDERTKNESPEEAVVDLAKQREQLALQLKAAAKSDGDEAELAAAEEQLEQARKAQAEGKKALERAKEIERQLERLRRNETEAEEAAKNAKAQAERTQKDLEEAEAEEERKAKESAKAADGMKDAIQMMKEKKEERERIKRMQEKEQHIETTITTTTTRLNAGFSLYCFTLMLPFGYEPRLLAKQKDKKIGFYRCDHFTAFSNTTVWLEEDKWGEKLPVEVEVLDVSLAVDYGGKWHTALNTPVFNKIWIKVRDMGVYLGYDWVVKADIDTVWFPERLRTVLRRGVPLDVLSTGAAGRRLQSSERRLQVSDGCRHCGLSSSAGDMCEDHVRWLQRNKNMSCEAALAATARPPPLDCGCKCTKVEACDLSADPNAWLDGHFMKGDYMSLSPAVYINNCRFGLHGPIEVLSKGAITAFVDGMPACSFLLVQPWGEDKYMDRCLMALGITRMNVFSMLSEIACGEEPAPCQGTDVAFHPFKKWEDFDACWQFANSEGHGPFSEGATDSVKADAGFI